MSSDLKYDGFLQSRRVGWLWAFAAVAGYFAISIAIGDPAGWLIGVLGAWAIATAGYIVRRPRRLRVDGSTISVSGGLMRSAILYECEVDSVVLVRRKVAWVETGRERVYLQNRDWEQLAKLCRSQVIGCRRIIYRL